MTNTELGAVVTSQGRGDGQDASTNPGAAKVTSNSLRSCYARMLGDVWVSTATGYILF